MLGFRGTKRYTCGASSVSQLDSIASTSRISYLHAGVPLQRMVFVRAVQHVAATWPPPQPAVTLAQHLRVAPHAAGCLASPAGIVLLRGVEAHPLRPAAEEHRGVMDAQLGCSGVPARRAHKAIHRGPCILLVCRRAGRQGAALRQPSAGKKTGQGRLLWLIRAGWAEGCRGPRRAPPTPPQQTSTAPCLPG